MLRKVRLRGPFKKFYDGEIEVEGETLHEIIYAVTSQIDGFKPNHKGRKIMTVPGYESSVDLFRKLRDDEVEFDFVPYFGGSGGGNGIFQVIIGAVLIVASFIPGLQFLAPLGVSMLLGGLLSLLSPTPELDLDNTEVERSKYLPSTQNTTTIGTRIPIIYGKVKTGGHYLSFDVDAVERGV